MKVDKNNICKFAILIIFMCAAIMAGFFAELDFEDIIKFIAVQIFMVFLPGIAMQNCLKINHSDFYSYFFTSYSIGYILNILFYIFFLMTNTQHLIPFFGYCIAILSCLLLYKNNKLNIDLKSDKRDAVFLSIVYIVALGIGFFCFQMNNRSALITGYQEMHQDLTYWFKNAIAVTKGYPAPELSVAGNTLFYHLFSSFQIAFLHYLTGIEIYDLCFTFSYIWELLLLTGSIYVLFNEFIKNKMWVYLALIVLLFTTGLESNTYMYYMHHIYRASFGFSPGYAISMYAFYFFIKLISEKKIRFQIYLIALLLFGGSLGLKAPCASVIMMGIGVSGVIELCKSENEKKRQIIAVGISYFLMFAVISKTFIIADKALILDNSIHHLNLSLTNTVFASGSFLKLYQVLKPMFSVNIAAFGITLIVFVFSVNFISNMALLQAVYVKITQLKKVKIDKLEITLIAILCAGYTLSLFISHRGLSQVYFMFESFPFVLLLAFRVLEKDIKESYKRIWWKLSCCTLIILGMVQAYLYNSTFIISGIKNMQMNVSAGNSTGMSVTAEEIVGLRWIRENVENEAVLITNKVLAESGNVSFVTSSYAERQVYLEGYNYTSLSNQEIISDRLEAVIAYYNGIQDAGRELKEQGVTYSVVFKNLTGIEDYTYYGKKLYENNELLVIQL